jgi:hypothetical protein
LDKITQRKHTREGRLVRAFNPLAREDRELCWAQASCGHHIRGFTSEDIRQRLKHSPLLGPKRQTAQQRSAKIARLFHRLHVDGLIGKVPRSRRWRLTKQGLRVMSSAIRLGDQTFPDLYAYA